MKVIKEKSREYKGESYYKYKINIPTKIVNDANIKEGDDYEFERKGENIILKKMKK